MDPTNDLNLIAQIRRNKKPAFDELFRRYYTPLCRYACKITQSTEKAEEAVQEIFIHLWENRNKLSMQSSVVSYLFQSVRNKTYEHFRKTQTRTQYEENYSELNNETSYEQQFNAPDNYELACLIWSAVDQLPDKCAEIFRLSRDEGLTYNEIAQHLDISVKTVENQMGIAFKKLRDILFPVLKSKGWSNYKVEMFLLLLYAGLCLSNL